MDAHANEVPGHSLPMSAWQGPEAAVLLGGVLKCPPQPYDRGRGCAQEGAVLVWPHLATYLGLLHIHFLVSA